MRPPDIVAIILAATILIFATSLTALQVIFGTATIFAPPETAQAWRDVINVMLGALAGYIGRGGQTNGPK